MKISKVLSGGLLLLSAVSANASLITGDFRTESNLPEFRTGSALVYESLGQSIGAGYELDGSDLKENPDNWGGGEVWMDYEASTNILTLNSQDTWDFQTFDAYISNIVFDTVGEYISGISFLRGELTDIGVVPTLAYTEDSVHISYESFSPAFNFTGGEAIFQIETSVAAVPEPTGLALVGAGLLALGFSRRKQAK